MKLSINPTYFCNFKCNWCYLGDLLSDRTRIDIDVLEQRLREVVEYEPIEYVDLYGGEIIVLGAYQETIIDVIKKYYDGPINVITNLSSISSAFYRDDVQISVSYDFECREKHQSVMLNMMMFPNDISVLMLASPCLMKKDVDDIIMTFNMLQNVKSVEIKPYSSSKYNQHAVTYQDFEKLIQRWIDSPIPKNFIFVNENNIIDCLDEKYNTFSDDHVYITPKGNFAVLEFDSNDNEFFLELNSLQEYIQWTKGEKTRVLNNKFCSTCPYLGHCLSEHLRDVKDIATSCNGFRGLLEYYNERT